MSWRTTAVLFVILLIVGGYAYYESQREPEPTPEPTPAFTPPENISLVTGVTIDDVNRLDVGRLEGEEPENVSFFREATGNWYQTIPTRTQVISQTMNAQVTGLVNLSSQRALPAEANPLSAYGLDTPTHEITLAAQQGERLVRFTFLVGGETPGGNNFYIQKRGDPRVFIVPKTTIQNMINLIDEPPLPEPH